MPSQTLITLCDLLETRLGLEVRATTTRRGVVLFAKIPGEDFWVASGDMTHSAAKALVAWMCDLSDAGLIKEGKGVEKNA